MMCFFIALSTNIPFSSTKLKTSFGRVFKATRLILKLRAFKASYVCKRNICNLILYIYDIYNTGYRITKTKKIILYATHYFKRKQDLPQRPESP